MIQRTGTALWLVSAVVIATALVPAHIAFAQARAERPAARGVLRVLFIGNSYTFYNNLGDLVAGIAARVVPLVDLPSATAGELQRIASDTVDARRREDRGPLVGTWALEAARAVSADGRVDPAPYGKAPTGLLTYTADGYMQVILSFSGRERLSGDFRSAPAAERAEAFATSLSYAGRYTVAGDRVVHHVEVATDPNRVGTRIERTVDLAGDRLTLTTPPTSIGGVPLEVTLTWRRVR